MLRIAVLVSGGGTNLQAILDAVDTGGIVNAEVAGVISNNKGAQALVRAERHGIPGECVSPRDYPGRSEFNQALLGVIDRFEPDLIVLAGYLVVVPDCVTAKYAGRIINIHPSLIPAFSGTGYYGLKVHEAALDRGVKIAGATVHFVDEGTDTGPILLQKAVAVQPDDTPEILQLRIMKEAEWVILPQAINLIANGKVKLRDGKAIITE